MEEQEYLKLADATLRTVTDAFEKVDPDLADAYLAGDVLTIAFASGVKCVLNTQRPTRQLWLAARSRAWHFGWDAASGQWRDDKDPAVELLARLREIVQENAGLLLDLPPGHLASQRS